MKKPAQPSSLAQEREIFLKARCCADTDAQAAYLDEACQGNTGLRASVESLLACRRDDAFLETPPTGVRGAIQKVASENSPVPTIDQETEMLGGQIGPYTLEKTLGEGGCGVVYAARQEQPIRRRIALKVIKLGMDTRSVIARFEAERQALAMMDHPSIAKVLDAGTTESGRPYFVMELVHGIHITKYCTQNNLSTPQRLELFIKVCQAVQHAHQKGIIHRDLKPSNILVTLNDGMPVPKVIDFGIAKAVSEDDLTTVTVTRAGQFLGTLTYASPEQASLGAQDIDTRSDIYSLGVLLYELLTGRPPFDFGTAAQTGLDEMRRLIREAEPSKPSTRLSQVRMAALSTASGQSEIVNRKSEISLDLDWIVMKALEKDRARRYETATAFAQDLRRHLNHETVLAGAPSQTYRLQKLVRRNKGAFAAATAVLLALVTGLGLTAWQAVRASRALNELRAAAPAFAEQARGLATKERYEEALEKLAYAAKLRPDVPDYLVAKGDLLQSQLRLPEAAWAYRAALVLRPTDGRTKVSATLCDELIAAPPGPNGKLSHESLSRLHLAMQQQQRPAAELMPVARLLGEERKLVVALWLARLTELPVSADRPLKKRLTVRDDGLLALDLSTTKIADLALLAGMPLGTLNLSDCKQIADFSPLSEFRSLTSVQLDTTAIRDLSPLRNLPLEELNISGTQAVDLSVLRGMKLRRLGLRNTRVADLSPLAGMPLTFFESSNIPATDYYPLAGAPLEICTIQNSALNDLSFLSNSPVRELSLIGCDAARGFGVLAALRSLELLMLSSGYRGLPEEEFAAIGALRSHPTLINIGEDRWDSDSRLIQAIQPKADFWKDWDREQPFVSALRKSRISFSLWKLPAGTYSLEIQDQPLSDLSMLAGAPITDLRLDGCQVTNLVAIRNLSLRVLSLSRNPVTDLGPLRGMQLEELFLDTTQVSDLAPLMGLPLKELHLDSCETVTDVAALAEIRTLEKVTVPKQARNIDALRKLPKLRMLAFNTTDNSSHVPASTAQEFWKAWPGLSWMRALNEAGMNFEASQDSEKMWRVTVYAQNFSDCSIFRGTPVSELTLSGTSVADLRPLGGLALTKLSLRRSPVTNLAALREPTLSGSLRQFHLQGTNVTDFSPLSACTNLEVIEVANAPLADLGILHGHNLRNIQLINTKVSDISVLARMPLTSVSLAGSPVTNLSPLLQCPTLRQLTLPATARDVSALRALPALARLSYDTTSGRATTQSAAEFWKEFEQPWMRAILDSSLKANRQVKLPDGTWELNLQDTGISDVTILSNAPISILSIGGTAVTNLAPLRGMRLKTLHLFGTKVTDLSPLQGMPIENLHLAGVKISDLTALRGMPLTSLRLHGCTKITNLTHLADTSSFKDLTLPPKAKDIEFLRNTNRFPNLRRLSFTEDKDKGYRVAQTTEEFWREFDQQSWRTALAKAGITPKRQSRLPDGTWEVDLTGTAIRDLTILSNAPISVLWLGSTAITDLAPLHGLRLKALYMYNTKIVELSPLRTMPIEVLNLVATKVADLSVLRGMPLRSLNLHGCNGMTNLSPLAGATTLKDLTLPPNAKNLEFLRSLSSLERLSYRDDPLDDYRPAQTPEEFWAEYDQTNAKP